MVGTTDWLIFAMPDGTLPPNARLVSEEFDANFVLLTRSFGPHRLSVRRDRFRMHRGEALTIDDGDAVSLSYSYTGQGRMSITAEYLEVESARDLWPYVYLQAREAAERQLRLRFQFDFAADR